MTQKTKRARILTGFRGDAKTYALKLLGYRARSRKELLEKLKRKGFDNGQIEHTIKFLENAALIDDKALASDLFRHSIERRSLGKRGIRMFLTRRGIDRELIEDTLAVYSMDMEEEAAREFVERKLKTLKNYPGDVIKRRLWGMLHRRGVSIDVINRVVNSIL